MDSTEKKIIAEITTNAVAIAKALKSGKEVEIRKTPSGIVFSIVERRKM